MRWFVMMMSRVGVGQMDRSQVASRNHKEEPNDDDDDGRYNAQRGAKPERSCKCTQGRGERAIVTGMVSNVLGEFGSVCGSVRVIA